MGNSITLVVATRNRGKTAEIRGLLEGFNVMIKNLDDFGPIPEVEEDGDTFDDNAYKKASFAARVLGLPALADDSGLLVHALDGARESRPRGGLLAELPFHHGQAEEILRFGEPLEFHRSV